MTRDEIVEELRTLRMEYTSLMDVFVNVLGGRGIDEAEELDELSAQIEELERMRDEGDYEHEY